MITRDSTAQSINLKQMFVKQQTHIGFKATNNGKKEVGQWYQTQIRCCENVK